MRLRPKAFALLRHLLDNPGRLLGREQLLDVLWPGVVVTDDSLTQCMGDLRHALGDRALHVLRTVPKRGYMLIAAVRREDPPSSEPGANASPALPAMPIPLPAPVRAIAALRRETITVHRFEAQDGDRACMLLANGVATDLIAALTFLEGLRVLPAADILSAEGYRIRGEVRAVGEELRITVLFEDVATGTALWAERLDQTKDGPPELSAPHLTALVVHIGQQVDRHCLAVARQKPVAALSARELHLIGREHHKRCTQADTEVAKQMFALAISADPEYAQAYAWQAYTVHRAITHGWGSPGGQEARDEALRLARRAVQIDLTSPLCLSRLAFTLMLHQQWDDAVATARVALHSDRPAFTAARNTCCEVLTHAGHAEEAAMIAQGTLVCAAERRH